MYEQLHATDLLLDCVTMCTVHYECYFDYGCAGRIVCHALTHVLDWVLHFDTYIGPGTTFQHIYWIRCDFLTH